MREGSSLAEAGLGSPRNKAWPGGGSAFRQAGTGESGSLCCGKLWEAGEVEQGK